MRGDLPRERLQGERRHRFGLALGLAVAVVLHVGLLLLPLPKETGSGAKQFQRGVVARAFRTPSSRPAPAAVPSQASAPQPARASAPRPAAGAPGPAGEAGRPSGPPELPKGAPPRAATEGALAGAGPSQPSPATPNEGSTHFGEGTGGGARADTAGVRPGPASRDAGKGVGTGTPGIGSGAAAGKGRTGKGPDEWTAMLADLANRGQSLKGRGGGEGGAGGSGGGRGRGAGGGTGSGRGRGGSGTGSGGGGADGDDVLDPRIRITVVSYPSSPIEESHPSVRYPDLRVHRRELTAGICRVYYRVWTDAAGRIVRTQVKTPETQEDLRRYAPFVEAVKDAVADWPFPKTSAEVHVDVLFEIE